MKTKEKAEIENKPMVRNESFLKIQARENILAAIRELKLEAKEYTYDWNCGFRLMDNGTIICQMYCGVMWVYSNERRFIFGNKEWKDKLGEDHLPCSVLSKLPKNEEKEITNFILERLFIVLPNTDFLKN